MDPLVPAHPTPPRVNTIPVFVYGTLKRGHGNHRELEGATFLGEAQTVDRYALHVQGLPMVDWRETEGVGRGGGARTHNLTLIKRLL